MADVNVTAYSDKRYMPGRIVQWVARLTQGPEVPVIFPVQPHTFVITAANSRKAVVSYWQKLSVIGKSCQLLAKVCALSTGNHLGDLSLSRNCYN